MKISTRGRYGIRMLIDLAERADASLTLASIAERQGISARYLEQVAVILKRAGFIRSVKGAAGGYALAKPAHSIIVGDALRELEGDMLIVDELPAGQTESRLKACLRAAVYAPLNKRIAAVIDTQTIESLAGTADSGEFVYFI